MKKLNLLVLLAAMAIFPAITQAQSKKSKKEQAPEAVTQAFQQSFGQWTGLETWHEMASGNWYAAVSSDTLQSKIEFTPDGQWIATRTALSSMQLPDTLTTAIQQRFPGAQVDQATRIQRADVAPYYQIALQVAGTQKDVLANDFGTITE
jgi:hypothetical protein